MALKDIFTRLSNIPESEMATFDKLVEGISKDSTTQSAPIPPTHNVDMSLIPPASRPEPPKTEQSSPPPEQDYKQLYEQQVLKNLQLQQANQKLLNGIDIAEKPRQSTEELIYNLCTGGKQIYGYQRDSFTK